MVESRMTTRITRESIPYPDFDTTNGQDSNSQGPIHLWSDWMGVGSIGSASPAVSRILTATSSSMSIIPVAAPYPNSSYSIQFYGPCLKCQSLDDALGSPEFDTSHALRNSSNSLSNLWDVFFDNSGKHEHYYAAG